MNRLLTLLFVSSVFCTTSVYAQNVGVGTSSPDNSAKLDVSSTDGGLLIPRMTEVQRDAIVTPATGLMIFQTDGSAGFYYYDGTAWTAIGSGSGTQGPAGSDGASAYQVAVNNGFVGTEADWLNSLEGADGATGATGPQGPAGADGADGATGATGPQGPAGPAGADGQDGADGGTLILEEISYTPPIVGATRTGYRIVGRDPALYNPIGDEAMDFSKAISAYGTSGAAGANSLAFGGGSKSGGQYSLAGGRRTNANGNSSFAMGAETSATGNQAVAIGFQTTASNRQTFASGTGSTASARYSTAMGENTIARSRSEFVVGMNNTDTAQAQPDNFISSNQLFVVGNGQTAFSKSDALVVYKSGNTRINGELTLSDGTSSITLPNTDGSSGQVLATDGAGNVSWSSVSGGSSLWTQGTGSTIYTTDNVGIGTSSGAYSLNVSGDASFQNGRLRLGGSGITNPGTAMTLTLNGSSTGTGNQSYINLDNNHILRIQDASSNVLMFLHSAGLIALDADNTADVAIGSLSATEKLDVNGKIRMRTGATAGYVPVADADGVMTWTDPSTLSTDGTGALEEVTDGANTGYRIVGRDPANYLPIGNRAIDLSYSDGGSRGASSFVSFATGYNTIASGSASTAMGSVTTASAPRALATGFQTTASGENSTSMGRNTTASGTNSTAMGSGTDASAPRALATGFQTTASGENSTAMGNGTSASGDNSTAIGRNTIANAYVSTAMGNATIASGSQSTAMGNATTASGSNSTAMGSGTTASGNQSVAMGLNTTASGIYSVASGLNSNAKSLGEFVIGINNTDYTPAAGSTGYSGLDRLFVIGNGLSLTSRSDAMIVYKNGNTDINGDANINGDATMNNATIYGATDFFGDAALNDGQLRLRGIGDPNHYLTYLGGAFDGPKLNGNQTVVLSTNGSLGGDDLVLKNNRVGINTDNPSIGLLHVNGYYNHDLGGFQFYAYNNAGLAGGTVDISIYASNRVSASEFHARSDARIKNIVGVSNSQEDLDKIMAIEVTDYTMVDKAQDGRNYKKVIAQQVESVYPDAVSYTTDVIPDIYALAHAEESFIALETEVAIGDKVKLFIPDGELITEVVSVCEQGFTVADEVNGEVFVYGREVNDSRTVDYDALSMLNISATQALYQRLVELEEANGQFQVQIDRIKAHIGLEEDNTASK